MSNKVLPPQLSPPPVRGRVREAGVRVVEDQVPILYRVEGQSRSNRNTGDLTVKTHARSLQEALHSRDRHDQLALQYRPIQDIFQQFPGFNVGFVGQVRLETEIQIHINRLIAGGLGG